MFFSKFHITSLFVIMLLILAGAGVYFNGYAPWWIGVIILIYLGMIVLGSIFIRWNFYFRSQVMLDLETNSPSLHIRQNSGKVALTFDDGPAAYTETILNILKEEQAAATFFVIGKNISGQESVLKRMVAEGHTIGNHSYAHGRGFDWKSSTEMAREIMQTNVEIERVTGKKTTLFRPPYGVTNPNLAKAVKQTGMKSIGWNIRSLDTTAQSEERLLRRILERLRPGAIILLHDRCAITAKILPRLIKEIYKRGFVLETLSRQ